MKILCPFWFLLMLISFFMSCDNVMTMCISFLFIELSSNQVCFLLRPFLHSLRNMSKEVLSLKIHCLRSFCTLFVSWHSSMSRPPPPQEVLHHPALDSFSWPSIQNSDIPKLVHDPPTPVTAQPQTHLPTILLKLCLF